MRARLRRGDKMNDYERSKVGSRVEKVGKKRKLSRVYYISLAIVIVAIFIVGSIVIFGDNEEQSTSKNNQPTIESDTSESDIVEETNETDTSQSLINEDTAEDKEDKEATEEMENTDETNTALEEVEGSSDSNVAHTYVNESWEAVGTVQTGAHEMNFTKGSVDWIEMEKALAYGAGLDNDNMTVWFLGNGGSDKAIGTISPKDKSKTYRVYIEWIDGEGWKPTKVEELVKNDKAS